MRSLLRYRHVMVAYDGSPEAELALAHAVALAQAEHARLALVAVLPPVPSLAWQAPGGVRKLHDDQQTDLERLVRAAADRVPDDLPVTTRLLDGDPPHELLRAAREGDHDVIVMGSRGRGRVSSALLGSVSNRIMHAARVPVIIVHAPRGDPDLAA
jgi:nucleotide-binding universal stress UspA family protein